MLYPILKQNKRKILKVHVFSPSVPPENNTKSVSEVQGTSTKIQRYICMYRDVCVLPLLDYLLIFHIQ